MMGKKNMVTKEYISVSDDKEKCESLVRDPYYGQVNDWTANFINTYLGFIFEEKAKEEEEEVEVCKALLDMKADARAEGDRQRLLNQVQKKFERGDSIEKIADDLMEDIEVINEIVKELKSFE